MPYVYLIQSLKDPTQRYIGHTTNLKNRIDEHNNNKCRHTSKYSPWELITAIFFNEKQRAIDFEKYLKSGSGHAFSRKRLWGKSR